MHGLAGDACYALRMLRQRPWAAAVIFTTIAIGVGANVAIFSVVNAMLLKPLPYPTADRLVGLWERQPSGRPNSMSTLNYLDYAASDVFEHVAATTVCCRATLLTDGATPSSLAGLRVSAPYFDVFGAKPLLGRTFAPGEDQPGHNRVVVLSHRLWASRFGSDPTMIGRIIHLDNAPYTVIGVMPANSPFDRSFIELWLPIELDQRMDRSHHWLLTLTGGGVAVLKAGITLERARAELDAIAIRLAHESPDTNRGWGVTLERYGDVVIRPELRRSLYLLLGAVALVLLIACVNVTHMMLAWALAREREVAVRLALGAEPRRIMRQFLTESALIISVGGVAGVAVGALATAGLRQLLAAVPVQIGTLSIVIPPDSAVELDLRVMAFAVIFCMACAIIAGVTPALALLRTTPGRFATAHHGTSRVQRRLSGALVVAQIALAFVLLTNAGLLLRSVQHMRIADNGFEPANVLTAQLVVPEHRFVSADDTRVFMRAVIARVRAIPGVFDAAFVDGMPMNGAPGGTFVQRADQPRVERAQRSVADLKAVGPAYFNVLGLRLRRGRTLSEIDRAASPLVAVVNDTMARKYFGDADPVGQQLLMDAPRGASADSASYEVIGVIADERLTPFDDRQPHAVVYVSSEQDPEDFRGVIVRASVDATRFKSAVTAAIASVDKSVAVNRVTTLTEWISDSMLADRVRLAAIALFAGIALLLAAIGIYGVITHSVTRRTHEISVRAALGATPSNLIALVVGQGARLVVVGISIGAAVAIGCARLLRSVLFGITEWDVVAWAVAAVVLTTIALLACYLPARDAARADPIQALRAD